VDRSQLATLYREQSMLTFEGEQFQGVGKIMEKIVGLPFVKVAHKISTLDSQPTTGGAAIVFVTGELLIDDGEHPQRYSQVFHLLPDGDSFFVLNDVFRLNYG